MSNASYDRGLFKLGNYKWDTDTIDIGVMLMKSTYVFSRSHATIADLTPGSNEASGTGYARKAVVAANRTVNEDGAAHAANLRIVDNSVLWTGLDAGVGLFVVLFFVDGTGLSDTANNLLGFIDSGTRVPINTNGGDVTLNFSSDGAIKLS